jgi:hypothetical protein
LELAPPNEAAEVDAYRRLRNQLFPNWYAMSQHYFAYEEKSPERKAILAQFPELKDYFDWNKDFKDQHPVIAKYKRDVEEETYSEYDYSFVQEFTPALSRQLLAYFYADQPLSEGTMRELRYVWDKNKRPGGTFDTFLEDVLQPLFPSELSIEK